VDLGIVNRLGQRVNMLPHETTALLDEVTSIPLSQRKEVLTKNLQKAAEWAVAAGARESEFALYKRVKVYHDHFEALGNQLWSEIKRVLEETLFESYPDCDNDILAYWQKRSAPVYQESANDICALLLPTNEMPKPAFKDHRERLEKTIFAEIKMFCAKQKAVKQEKMKNKVAVSNIYYLQGANSRVNNNSKDSSINVVGEGELFSNLRKTLETEIEDAELKAKLSVLTDEMEKCPKSSVFRGAYAQFMELAAHHMDVIGPFLPALSQLLG
jgi:hypothetical protein